jgi:hypothetical protein
VGCETDPDGAAPKTVERIVVPSERTIVRILGRQGLARSRPRKRPRDSYVRWERPGPMQLWGIDIVGGVLLVDPATGELREAKVLAQRIADWTGAVARASCGPRMPRRWRRDTRRCVPQAEGLWPTA